MKRYRLDIVKLYQSVWPPHPLDFGVDPAHAVGAATPIFMTTEDTFTRVLWALDVRDDVIPLYSEEPAGPAVPF